MHPLGHAGPLPLHRKATTKAATTITDHTVSSCGRTTHMARFAPSRRHPTHTQPEVHRGQSTTYMRLCPLPPVPPTPCAPVSATSLTNPTTPQGVYGLVLRAVPALIYGLPKVLLSLSCSSGSLEPVLESCFPNLKRPILSYCIHGPSAPAKRSLLS